MPKLINQSTSKINLKNSVWMYRPTPDSGYYNKFEFVYFNQHDEIEFLDGIGELVRKNILELGPNGNYREKGSFNVGFEFVDAEKMLSYFMDSPDFVYTRNGRRRYDEFVDGCPNLPKIFEKIECRYNSIQVDVIYPSVAIATVAFDATLINIEQEKIDIEGAMARTF